MPIFCFALAVEVTLAGLDAEAPGATLNRGRPPATTLYPVEAVAEAVLATVRA